MVRSAILDGIQKIREPEPRSVARRGGLPDIDDPIEDLPSIAAPDFSDAVFLLFYENARGDESDRVVRVRSFARRGEFSYINAYCFERSAFRQFRIDRIIEVCDADTGEIISENPAEYFADAVRQTKNVKQRAASSYKRAFNLLYPGIKSLVYVARCDGHFHELEIEIIQKYCEAVLLRLNENVEFDSQIFSDYTRRLCPSFEDFKKSFEKASDTDRHEVALLYRYMRLIIDADGQIHNEEIGVAEEIRRLEVELANSVES